MKKLISAVIFTSCIAVASHAFGLTQKTTETAQSAVVTAQEVAKTSEFNGVIKKLDDGTALYTENEIYPLLGGNFETIIGKKVLITGKVVKEDDVKKIAVARVQFAKE